MDLQTLQAWAALFVAAETIGADVVDAIKYVAGERMTPEELAQVLALWTSNAERSRRNAGLPPE